MSSSTGENTNVTPVAATEPSTHPLTRELAEAVRGMASMRRRVLLLGIGSGRHVAPLLAAGAWVDAVESDATRAGAAAQRFAQERRVRIACAPYGAIPFADSYDAALSTHALLHGTRAGIAATLAATYASLAPGAPLFATLGSTADPRYGAGTRIDDDTFAPTFGSEIGVAHAYFDERGVRSLLHAYELETLIEGDASQAAGRWAHTKAEADAIVHWFVRARRR